MLAAALILPISNTLHALLDRSPAGEKMVAIPDYGWWETVRRVHPDLLGNFPEIAQGLLSTEGIHWSELPGMRGVGATAFSLALLATVLHAFALGGALGVLREPSSSLVTFGREGMRRMPAFLVFTFASLAAAFAAYEWIYVQSGEALRSRVRDLHTEQAALAVTGLRLAALLLALAVIKLLADSVRTVWVARPDLPPVSRFLFGIGGAIARPLRLFGILGLYAVSTTALYVIWLVLDPSAGGEARVRARAADPHAAGLRLRPPADQDRLLRRDLRGADARARARVLLRARRRVSAGRRARSPARRGVAPGRSARGRRRAGGGSLPRRRAPRAR